MIFNLIKYIPRMIWFSYVISKKQLLTHSGNYRLPKYIKIFAYFFCNILYIKGIFIKPKDSFGKRLTDFFYELGPIYIKFGQTLSTRPDLIGREVAEHLKYLQDKLPPFDTKIVHEKIESRFGKKLSDLFLEFSDQPVAAASIAQVHKAKLKNGQIVAVKVLRPEIKTKYEKDMRFLEFGANLTCMLMKKAERLKPKEVIAVFRKSMQFELDLRSEAAAASKMYDNFASDHSLKIPKIHWDTTAHDVITLEWIDGVSIYDREKIISLGLNPKDLATKIAIIFFNQAYRDGFFHADLHPGNIIVCQDGRIALVDFGIVGFLPENDRLAIAEILYAFLQRDYQLVAEIHQRIGYIPQDTDLYQFAMSCRAVAEPIIGLAIKDVSIGNLLAQLFKITEEYGMETQPQLLLLQKTMVVVEGIGQSLDENINMWQLAEPWIKKWAAKNLSPEAKALRVIKKLFREYCKL
jgi:ubiquinone biosynthesis protein